MYFDDVPIYLEGAAVRELLIGIECTESIVAVASLGGFSGSFLPDRYVLP